MCLKPHFPYTNYPLWSLQSLNLSLLWRKFTPTRKDWQLIVIIYLPHSRHVAHKPVLCSVLSGVCIIIEISMFRRPERLWSAQITFVVDAVNPPHCPIQYTYPSECYFLPSLIHHRTDVAMKIDTNLIATVLGEAADCRCRQNQAPRQAWTMAVIVCVGVGGEGSCTILWAAIGIGFRQ